MRALNEIRVDILVIGAGQAGLSIAYYLRKQQLNFVVIDQTKEIGEVWKSRYDSLVLFTPRWYSSLPGLPLEGDPNGYASKDEMANYLQTYAKAFDFPIHLQTRVSRLEKRSATFQVQTNRYTYIANKVIVATGPFQKSFIPPGLADHISNEVFQVHSSSYKNSKQLKEGNVLIVGAGNSGAQLAVELSADREVYLSVGHRMKFMPLELMGKSIFWWFQKAGILQASKSSFIGQKLSQMPDPIFGKQLKQLIARRIVHQKPRTIAAKGNEVVFADQSQLKVDNIIWSTGFYSDYSWICIPGALDENGKPVHARGISPISGLYFLGLSWQYRRDSALIGGVGQDAAYLYNHILMDRERKE